MRRDLSQPQEEGALRKGFKSGNGAGARIFLVLVGGRERPVAAMPRSTQVPRLAPHRQTPIF